MYKTACFFGSYDPSYTRNRVLIKGLSANSVRIYQCHESGFIFIRYWKLLKVFLKNKDKFNSIIVGFPGHYDVPLAFFLGKFFKKRVLFDVFVSLYSTYIMDRKTIKNNSLRSCFFYLIDWISLRMTDYLITDTEAHYKMYQKLFNLKSSKHIVIYIGADTDYFYPVKTKEDIDVFYHGSYQPLNGVLYMIKAAAKLPKVKFKMIGNGPDKQKAFNLARKLKIKNIEFSDWLSPQEICHLINRSKLLLGTVGGGLKAHATIPNKLYEGFACSKLVITGKTIASKEFLKDQENCLLVENENPGQLKKMITLALKDHKLRNKIALNCHKLFTERFTPPIITRSLLDYL